MNAIDLRTVSGLDRASGLDTVVIRVCPLPEGWRVREAAYSFGSRATSDFKNKSDALYYAISLAGTKRWAVVEIYRDDGALEARSDYRHDNGFYGIGRRR
ncbi:MAG: hypothetical protein ACYC9J_12445 [Sulfuricaulis sp.]